MDVVDHGTLNLISNKQTIIESTLPETYRMDTVKLQTLQTDLQDLTILSVILTIFRTTLCTNLTTENMKIVKDEVWILLNDCDSDMTHVCMHLQTLYDRFNVSLPGMVVKKPIKTVEQMEKILDQSLAPASPLFILLQKRILSCVFPSPPKPIQWRQIGLETVQTEVKAWAVRLVECSGFNKKCFGAMFAEMVASPSLKDYEYVAVIKAQGNL